MATTSSNLIFAFVFGAFTPVVTSGTRRALWFAVVGGVAVGVSCLATPMGCWRPQQMHRPINEELDANRNK